MSKLFLEESDTGIITISRLLKNGRTEEFIFNPNRIIYKKKYDFNDVTVYSANVSISKVVSKK